MTSEMGRRSLTLPKCSHFQRLGLPQCLPMPSWLHKPSFGEIAQAHLQLCPVSQPSGRNPCLIAHPGHISPGPTATRPYEGSVSVRTRANRTPHLLVSRVHPKGRLARDACRTLDVEVLCQFLGRRGRAISRPVYGAMPRIPGLPCPCSAYPDVRTNGGTHVRACILNTYDTETWVDWCFFRVYYIGECLYQATQAQAPLPWCTPSPERPAWCPPTDLDG